MSELISEVQAHKEKPVRAATRVSLLERRILKLGRQRAGQLGCDLLNHGTIQRGTFLVLRQILECVCSINESHVRLVYRMVETQRERAALGVEIIQTGISPR